MRSKVIERLLTITLLASVGFYLFSSSVPFWAVFVLTGLTIFSYMLLVSDLGCSMVFVFPSILLVNFVVAGIVKIEFFTSIMLSLIATALVLTVTSSGVLSIFSLIFLGVYMSLAKPHGTVADLLCFGLLLGMWYSNKSKLFKIKVVLTYVLSVLVISVAFSNINLVPLKPILSAVPVFHENQNQKEQEAEQQIVFAQRYERQQISKKSWLTDFIDKVWFPSVLALFGLLLFSFSVSNFGLKGTLRLLMLGALTFTIFVCCLSLLFRFIKPTGNALQETPQFEQTTQNDQQIYQPLGTATVVIQDLQIKEPSVNLTRVLDIVSILALSFMIVVLIYSLLKTARLRTFDERKAEEKIPQDVELYPLEVIPEYEPTERFVLGAYWWLRRRYFSEYHHLTPFELLVLSGTNEYLSKMSDIYVKLRYGKRRLTEQDTRFFYEQLLKFVAQHETKLENTTSNS